MTSAAETVAAAARLLGDIQAQAARVRDAWPPPPRIARSNLHPMREAQFHRALDELNKLLALCGACDGEEEGR